MRTIEKVKNLMKNNKFKKHYGQNFLVDDDVLDEIIFKSEIDKTVGVIEIGPGIGVLTQRLCQYAKKVVAIEIDTDLIPILVNEMDEYDNFTVINQDVLKIDINNLITEHFSGLDVKVVANLPYYITTPIVMKLLEQTQGLKSIVVMVQKEVADRFCATCDKGDFGAVSLTIDYYSNCYQILSVPKHCFMPAPKVDSAVIRMDIRKEPPVLINDTKFFFNIIKGAFAHRRKTLVNSILGSGLGIKKENIINALKEMDINENIRGEKLSIEQFAGLSNILGG